MSAVSDAIITYALLKRITTPIKETRAYKMGLVNDEGAVTEKGHHDHSEQARDALTLLDRLVFKLKRIWKYTPALLKFVSSYSFALAALKEEAECFSHIESSLCESVQEMSNTDRVLTFNEASIVTLGNSDSFVRTLIEAYMTSPELVEEVMAAGNSVSSGQVASLATEPVVTKKKQAEIVASAESGGGRHVVSGSSPGFA